MHGLRLCVVTRKLFVQLGKEVRRRREPIVVRILARPIVEGVLIEKRKMHGLFGEKAMGLVAIANRDDLVTYPQRAHLERSEVLVAGSSARGCGKDDRGEQEGEFHLSLMPS